jgi:hypothetical protein
MKYFKNTATGEVFAYEADGSQDELIEDGLVRMSQKEVTAHLSPPKTDEQIREEFKNSRDDAVSRITVTTAAGQVFDGDEISQGRMARAILGMQSQPEGSTVQWVLHDNTVVDVGIAELQEALTLAGIRQTELWVQA